VPEREDLIESYYREKLWAWLPAMYRAADEEHRALLGLITLLARQAASLRRSQDRLWEDQFIELCDDWAVPYLGDLVATRLVSALDLRGRRADVARTVHYRRGAGTPGLLNELIVDITGWDGLVVEMYRRLLRTPHRLDFDASSGRTSVAPGLPCTRDVAAMRRSAGPCDGLQHTPDVRRGKGSTERHGISKVAFHLYRRPVAWVAGVTPYACNAGGRFTFDPSGRPVPLWSRGRARAESRREWELPRPISRGLMGDVRFSVDEAAVTVLEAQAGALAAEGLRRLLGPTFATEESFRRQLQAVDALAKEVRVPPDPAATQRTAAIYRGLAGACMSPECGKRGLLSPTGDEGGSTPRSLEILEGGSPIRAEEVMAADFSLGVLPTPAQTEKRLAIDPEEGQFAFIGGSAGPPTVG
jgi:hypothetical protein